MAWYWPKGTTFERFLTFTRVFGGAVPNPDIILTGEPLLVLRSKPDHSATLRTDKVLCSDADGPAQPRRHTDDLVGGVNRRGTPDLRYCRHLLHSCEHLQSDHGGLETQEAVQIAYHAGQVELFRQDLLLHGV